MKKKDTDSNIFILSTGREISANRGIIGLSEPGKDGEWEISEGYDGEIFSTWDDWRNEGDRLAPGEQREIAEYMINLWKRFRENIL